MQKYSTEAIRAVALVGHGAAGKTTLAEALLGRAGAIRALGSVERGNTVCDFDPLEKTYGHSLIVAPWGEVLARLDKGPGVCAAEIDPARISEVRSSLPALKHKRL